MSHVHRKDIEQVNGALANFRCTNCCAAAASSVSTKIKSKNDEPKSESPFKIIGTIRTDFAEKRAVPRQASIAQQLVGCIELAPNIFTNPEHALAGLDEFSHFWIIYHFHRIDTACTKSKVAPPRLNGQRVGVFSTRSPHRPSPIGLSLVTLNRIEGSRIYFHGTDMVDGTPVIDIKPYIPVYDRPISVVTDDLMVMAGSLATDAVPSGGSEFFNSPREDPDGEESDENVATNVALPPLLSAPSTMTENVRVPDWVLAEPTLKVMFNERADVELQEIGVDRVSIDYNVFYL